MGVNGCCGDNITWRRTWQTLAGCPTPSGSGEFLSELHIPVVHHNRGLSFPSSPGLAFAVLESLFNPSLLSDVNCPSANERDLNIRLKNREFAYERKTTSTFAVCKFFNDLNTGTIRSGLPIVFSEPEVRHRYLDKTWNPSQNVESVETPRALPRVAETPVKQAFCKHSC